MLPGPASRSFLQWLASFTGHYHRPPALLQTCSSSSLLGLELCSESCLELLHQLLCISQCVLRHQFRAPIHQVVDFAIDDLLAENITDLPILIDVDFLRGRWGF